MNVELTEQCASCTRVHDGECRWRWHLPLPTVYWVIFGFVLVAGLFLRWVLLDQRPVHHDESLHIMYGFYFFDHPEHNFYRYNPMLHGPFLYHLLVPVYGILGVSEWAARSPMALLGTLFMGVPFFFRRYFSPGAMLVLTTAIAFSPSLVYWSRFLRHDYLVLTWWLLAAYGLLKAPARWKPLIVGVAITLQFCTKENVYVTAAILAGYLVFEFFFCVLFGRVIRVPVTETLLHRLIRFIGTYPYHVVASLLVCIFVFAFFFTAGFRYSGGPIEEVGRLNHYLGPLLDGLYRKSVAYWMEHHGMERIKGPFLFHFYMLSWYEFLFVVGFLVHLVLLMYRSRNVERFVGMFLGVAVMLVWILFADRSPAEVAELQKTALWDFFKLKDHRDLVGLVFLLCYAPYVTVFHLRRGERTQAFWGYFFGATMFTYSYLGEKVPWLSMYPLVTGLIYLTLFFDQAFRGSTPQWMRRCSVEKTLLAVGVLMLVLAAIFTVEQWEQIQKALSDNRYLFGAGGLCVAGALVGGWLRLWGTFRLAPVLFVVAALFNLRIAILTNYVRAGESSELISQVHTTKEFDVIAKRIRHEWRSLEKGYRPRLLTVGDAVWPMTSYMIGIPEFQFHAEEHERAKFDYIIQNWTETPPASPPGYHVEKIKLRGWWVPNYTEMTFKNYLMYALHHRPWSTTGYAYSWLLTKR